MSPTAFGLPDDDPPRYRIGESLSCRIVAAAPGGFEVLIVKDNVAAFLPSELKLKIGEEVRAQFVCFHKSKALVTARTPDLINNVAASYTAERKALASAENPWNAMESQSPFGRRATDLLLPALAADTRPLFDEQHTQIKVALGRLEGEAYTGCIIASSSDPKSRSGALLYRGRLVGCTYGQEGTEKREETERAFSLMVQRLKQPATDSFTVRLPEQPVECLISLFLGYPVERIDDHSSADYFDLMRARLAMHDQTGCIAIATQDSQYCLALIRRGQYIGAYHVALRHYETRLDSIYYLLEGSPEPELKAYILPPECTSFGFSLTIALEIAESEDQVESRQDE